MLFLNLPSRHFFKQMLFYMAVSQYFNDLKGYDLSISGIMAIPTNNDRGLGF